MAAERDNLRGRTAIYTDVEEITAENIQQVLEDALSVHEGNSTDIDYLYGYYKGDQAIASRTKDFNSNILNKVCVNRCYEITNFKVGYLLSAPIQYVDAAANDMEETVDNDDLNQLNKWCMMRDKDQIDCDVALWQSIGGTAYKIALPNPEMNDELDPCPFVIHDLDPRNTFVVYSSRLGHKPMLGVTYVEEDDGNERYYCYTATQYFEIKEDNIEVTESHILQRVPIIEYPSSSARLGDFEIILPLQNATNALSSDAIDAQDQFVQAILVLTGMDIPEAERANFLARLKEEGGLILPDEAKAEYLTLVLNQEQNQVALDNLYDEMLTVCGMPNRNLGGTSTADTGYAVLLRNGYSQAEARANNTVRMFKKSERQFLDLLVYICNNVGGTNLVAQDIDITFPRRNYTNDSANVSNLITLLSNDWVRPEFAYEHSNLTPDPHREYLLAKKWHEEQENREVDGVMTNPETTEEVVDVAVG
jgi:SPP1 family phage portal protein